MAYIILEKVSNSVLIAVHAIFSVVSWIIEESILLIIKKQKQRYKIFVFVFVFGGYDVLVLVLYPRQKQIYWRYDIKQIKKYWHIKKVWFNICVLGDSRTFLTLYIMHEDYISLGIAALILGGLLGSVMVYITF